MFKSTRKSKMVKVAAATAAVGSIAAIGFIGTSPAQAEPKQYEAFVAVGSDTTQDIMNAFSGFTNGQNFVPLQSSAATGQQQVISFNAGAESCIATKTGAGLILRPNGSSGGRRALSQIGLGQATWGTGSICGPSDNSGLFEIARSSSGPSSGDTATDLTYVPFARDALTFAHYRATGSPATDTTRSNLDTIFTNGTGLIGTTPVIPCGIQTSSGTYGSWNSTVGVSGAEMEAATTLCKSLGGVPDAFGRLQEHDGPQLKIKGDLLAATSSNLCDGVVGGEVVSCANAQVIVGFSASQFVARSKGFATPAPGPGIGLGSIAGSSFVTGSGATLAANPAGYADPIFGRDVYNVFLTPVIDDPSNQALRTLFVGPTSAVCQADLTVSLSGFLPLSDAACGTTTTKGAYLTGNS